jgi:dihydrofolate synthase/folylpolyglutamate synthase
MPRFNNLNDWLTWQEELHWSTIDLGLDRIRQVAENMGLSGLPFPVITVAGTNGKGSTVAMLDALLSAEGYCTGVYTSPFILEYNERIKIAGDFASDELICDAFETIDQARKNTSLTYFEFGTLAAVWLFVQHKVDVAILEVGMGGRLDAVNIWDAALAIITNVDIDHVQWLGSDREKIAIEKSGIMRGNSPAICGDPSPPSSIATEARRIGATLFQLNTDFFFDVSKSLWHWKGWDVEYKNLPRPALSGDFQFQNAATTIAGLNAIKKRLPVSEASMQKGLGSVHLPGRLEIIQRQPDVIVDVAHNPHAAKQLALWLHQNDIPGKTYTLFSMLADKDIKSVVTLLNAEITEWHIAPINDERGLKASQISEILQKSGINSAIKLYDTVTDAWKELQKRAAPQDRIIVFGSFFLVSELKYFLKNKP